MNIWLINPYDELPGEGTEGRYARLAREMAGKEIGELGNLENGTHQVVWVSSAFRHRGKRAERAGYGIRDTGYGFKLVLVDAPGYKKNISLRRLGSQWGWGRRVEKEMLRRVASGELEKPDNILASSPPLEGARAGLRLAKVFGAKGIVDVMDDWPATWLQVVPRSSAGIGELRNWGVRAGLGGARLLLLPWFRLARQNMERADAVCAQSHAFAARAKELGFQGEVHVCYLGGSPAGDGRLQIEDGGGENFDVECSLSEHRTSNIEHPTLKELGHRSPTFDYPLGQECPRSTCLPPPAPRLTILYLGAMGHVYDIETVLQAAVLAREEGLVWQWSLVGNDPEGKWRLRSEELGLGEQVKFTGYLQGEDLDLELLHADVGLVPMDPRSGVAVPYKVGDYLGAGLPVVNSLPGELATLLRESGAGANYSYGDAKSLLEAIKMFSEGPQRMDAKTASQVLYRQKFDRNDTYAKFADWIRAVRG